MGLEELVICRSRWQAGMSWSRGYPLPMLCHWLLSSAETPSQNRAPADASRVAVTDMTLALPHHQSRVIDPWQCCTLTSCHVSSAWCQPREGPWVPGSEEEGLWKQPARQGTSGSMEKRPWAGGEGSWFSERRPIPQVTRL